MKKMISKKLLICILVFGVVSPIFTEPFSNINTDQTVTFKNDITTLHKLDDQQIISDLKPLIDNCKVLVNGETIKKGLMARVPVTDGKCTITIIGRFSYFYPIFDPEVIKEHLRDLIEHNIDEYAKNILGNLSQNKSFKFINEGIIKSFIRATLPMQVKLIGRFTTSHIIFSYEIHPEDLVVTNGHEGHIDISNVIIDLVDKYDLWEGNSTTPDYHTEFSATTRSTKITIIDPEEYKKD